MASGLRSVTCRIFIRCASLCTARNCFRFGLRLATQINSLALASRRAMQCRLCIRRYQAFARRLPAPSSLSHCIILSPFSLRLFGLTFRFPFQRSLALLIRYRSWLPYLGLEVDSPVFTPHARGTLLFWHRSVALRLRGFHSLWQRFPAPSPRETDVPPHISGAVACAGFRAPCSALNHLYWPNPVIGFFSARY